MKKSILKQGDKVSLQSLSGGMAGDPRFIHKFKIGKKRITEIGLVPMVSSNALKGIEYISKYPKARAQDFLEAFIDKDVKAIIANIGGFDSHKIIPFLDKNIIKANPKPILGYSDITSLHLYMYTLGIQTYYGPSILDGFAENVEMHNITKHSVTKTLFTNELMEIKSSKYWTSQFLDWSNKEFNDIKRKLNMEKYGHIWNNFNDKVISGHLIGGCLDSLVQIKNQKFFPKIKHWKDSIIFLETSEQKMKPKEFEKALKTIEAEILVCKAILFGKPKDEEFFNEYLKIARNIIEKPFIFNLNIGHTAPIYTIPYGGIISLDSLKNKIQITK